MNTAVTTAEPARASGGATPRDGRYHGFDLVRIAAALAVVLTHSFSTTGHSADKPLLGIGERELGPGSLGVAVFFVISGFLVTESWRRAPGARRFLVRRVVRIWPALVTMLLLTTFVLGPIVTDLSLGAYLTDPQSWRYAWKNGILVTGVTFELPGVFTTNPGPPVNSSLWTLPYEIWCYLGLVLLGMIGALRSRTVVLGLFLVALGLHVVATPGDDPWISAAGWGLSARKGAELATMFLGGAVIALWRSAVDRRWLLAGGAVLMALAFPVGQWGLFVVGLPALVVGLGTTSGPISRAVGRWGDPSYGVYILSYPLQQVLVATGVVTTSWAMFALAAPLALVLGYLSWHLVESPALRRGRRRPGATPGATAGGSP
ncbi:MAG TPA: acyltransferase [Iamia sp.]